VKWNACGARPSAKSCRRRRETKKPDFAVVCSISHAAKLPKGSADSRRLQILETLPVHHPIERLVSSTVKLQSKLHRLHTTGKRSVSRRAYRKALPDVAQISFNSLLLDWFTGGDPRMLRHSTDNFGRE
jgi:hypothetical protein